MKRLLIYLFSVSITLQSVVGQLFFYNHPGHTSYAPALSWNNVTKKIDSDIIKWTDGLEQPGRTSGNDRSDNEASNRELPMFVRDSAVEHLFSPSGCPNETPQLVVFSFLFSGICFDLFIIEEKINNFVHFYSTFFRNIEIGLPITKLIYPYHNFY